ncbi:MAG: sensor histidine kinase, partial [Ilumatobacteraceae bacterium]
MFRRDWWSDVGPAAVVAVAGTLGAIHIEAEAGERPADAATYIIVGLAAAALLARRRWPLPALIAVMAALGAYTLRNDPGGPVYLAGPVALYSLAVARPRVVGYVAAAVVTVVQVVARVVADGDGLSLLDLLFAGWAAVAVLAADAMRARQDRHRHHQDESRRRIAEERLQLARDLHDSVAHSMAAINVQSGVAAHVLGRRPEQAAEALEAIRVASRDALDELGAMLDVLRDGEAAPRQPAPDLARLDQLVASSRRAGLDVDLQVVGDVRDAPPAVGAAGYRIVQEALTNVVRHVATSHAIVRVMTGPPVRVEVLDNGTG